MKQSVITIGTFDGVHKGHQVILNKVVEISKKENLKSIIIFFENPVKQVSGLITSVEEKIDILSSYNVNEILLLPVNKKIISLTAKDFLEKILIKKLNVKHIVVGYDCTFGKDRQGDISWLKQQVKKYNILLHVIKPVKVKNIVVSSSKIRNLINDNNIALINKMLGRNFEISGVHVSGNQIGRKIGFPTINIKVDTNKLLPNGVFVCHLQDKKLNTYYGVLNIGIRPTIDLKQHNISIEVHLINFNGIWKDKKITLFIDKFIRNEKKFDDIEILKKSINNDIKIANQFLKEYSNK